MVAISVISLSKGYLLHCILTECIPLAAEIESLVFPVACKLALLRHIQSSESAVQIVLFCLLTMSGHFGLLKTSNVPGPPCPGPAVELVPGRPREKGEHKKEKVGRWSF